MSHDTLSVRLGRLGSAEIPLEAIASVGRVRWPWWAGLGVRIARGAVAFVPAAGDAVVAELARPVPVKAPLEWSASRVVIATEDPARFAAALAAAVDAARGGEASGD